MAAAEPACSGKVASASDSSRSSSPKTDGQIPAITPPTTATLSATSSPTSGTAMQKPALRQGPSGLTLQTAILEHEKTKNLLGRRGTGEEFISATSLQRPGARVKPQSQGLDTEALSAPDNGNATPTNSSVPSVLSESPPLCVSSILPNTRIAQPKPIAVPVSASSPLSLSPTTPLPDPSIRSGAPIGNIARLEATAERLSTGTSSIGDAIRELHGELKRSDSRRSSVRAASIRTSNDDHFANVPPVPPLHRHLSSASSILTTNIAARQGGYSPAGFVMSPSHSLTGRLRSGSKNSAGRPEIDVEPPLSRHGPGKTSVRSVRSAKMSLAEISESEPISLTKDALDAADAAPPIETETLDEIKHSEPNEAPNNRASRILESSLELEMSQPNLDLALTHPEDQKHRPVDEPERPGSAHSYSTFQQVGDAFADFDGVHCVEDGTFDRGHHLEDQTIMEDIPLGEEEMEPVPRQRRPERARPQSYLDPESGQQMLFYPARVPAMLKLPPKLSNKPKVADRDNRRSQVLSAMLDPNYNYEELNDPEAAGRQEPPIRDSWLPDPLAGNRESFIALTSSAGLIDAKEIEQVEEPMPAEPDSQHLRRPQKIGRNKAENRKSRLDKLPPQLRASAFFDLPSTSPKMEVKDGSAMATLDSMLDASMNAPVNAFTNHTFAGPLGSEVYGKEKKTKPKATSNSLAPPSPQKEPKKRASFLWFKRNQSETKIDSKSSMGEVNSDTDALETAGLASSHGEDHPEDEDLEGEDVEEEEESEDDQPAGPPTTLLAELQLRKQQQKQRTQPISQKFQDGMHATLLEMDAVAEVERKNRNKKRVNLAWEDPGAHHNENGSDDEDVPLAIIAAKHQGAKNMADLERPIGLLERRDIEDNEPLSRRRARLQGNDAIPMALPKRQSVATLTAHLTSPYLRVQPQSPGSVSEQEPTEEEIEGETLGERKRRLGAKELPKARPVSSAFSAELLSQFGDLEEATKPGTADGKTKENSEPAANPEEETLGERRRRLQAERRAREIEMSHNALVGPSEPTVNRRLSMADMLSAHPKKEENPARLEKLKMDQEAIIARDREAKLAAMRRQMPTSMAAPTIGGYRGGVYNDGHGGGNTGLGLQGAMSTPALGQTYSGNTQHRSVMGLSSYGMPGQQPGYVHNNPYGGMNGMNSMGNLNRMTMNPYAHNSMHQLPMQSQLPMNTSSMSRVDQWRHGVVP
ncbi:unnamed protein product [Clonostachys chloroleuca]|uniref:Uncharacterized protein n=1 Tax=Clonostachys chloroleuca TaxID=1926264 RepID=A0AA35Q383_9HYPO|nr:unnamed protein product [Clonostachys chloroleuca]